MSSITDQSRTTPIRAAKPGRFRGLWRHPDFLKLWLGETVSLFGTQITFLAVPLTAVLLLEATPAQMGLLTAIEFAPFLLVTLFVGAWLDRRRRRPVLIASNLGRGVLLVSIPVAAMLGLLSIEYLYVVVFLAGIMAVFFEVAYQSFLPTLLKRDELVEGNSKLFASASVADTGGPGLAGVLVGLLTAPIAILVDALSFLVAGFTLSLVKKPEPDPERQPARKGIMREIREGMRALFEDSLLRVFAAEATLYNFFNQAFVTLFVLYASRELGLRPEAIGFVFAVGSVGSLLGSIFSPRVARRIGVGKTITLGAGISCFSPLLLPLAGLAGDWSLPLLMLGYALVGGSISLCNVQVFSLRQALMPEGMRGRMIAGYRFITWGAIPVGAFASGMLAQAIGVWPTLLVGAIGLTTPWLLFFFSPVRQLREMPASPDANQEKIQAVAA